MSETNFRFRRPVRPIARGVVDAARPNLVQTLCRFEPDTFEQLRDYAKREHISLAEAIRIMVDWGLEALNGVRP